MLSLQQIKKKLITYLTNHGQVNEVVWADDFEFSAERNLSYPVVNIEFLEATVSGKMLGYSFKVTIGDMVAADQVDLQTEVISDNLLIAEDFLTYLQYAEGWEFNRSTSLVPFRDDTGDRVSGVVFRFVLNVVRSQKECATPTKD
ncbi:hypothetical protein [Flaviaesturariibacter amylovorans]|uniref:Uncharacterized protein n=1 Tax=Flaviaesturariibacter amylovorans TaxID=1084520 RepID=A0ABP8GL03_9BACT